MSKSGKVGSLSPYAFSFTPRPGGCCPQTGDNSPETAGVGFPLLPGTSTRGTEISLHGSPELWVVVLSYR